MEPRMKLELRRWLESAPKFKVNVTEPRQVGGLVGLGSTWSFTITSHTSDEGHVTLHRQYRDFFLLRDLLTKRYQGMILAELPHDQKKVVVSSSAKDAVLQKRSDVLNLFLHSLTNNPFIARDDLFIGFLRSPTQKFSQLVNAVENVSKNQKETGPQVRTMNDNEFLHPRDSQMWWKTACKLADYPAKPVETIKIALGELEPYAKLLLNTKQAFKKVIERVAQAAHGYEDLTAAFDRWQVLERSSEMLSMPLVPESDTVYAASVFGEVLNQEEIAEHPVRAIDLLRAKTNSLGDSRRRYCDRLEKEVLPKIRFEMLLIEGAINQLHVARDKMDKRLECQKLSDSLQAELDAVHSKNVKTTSEAKLAARKRLLEKQLAESQQSIEWAEERTDDLICAVLAIELPRLMRQRAERANNLCDMVSGISLATSQAEFSCWCSEAAGFGRSRIESIGSLLQRLHEGINVERRQAETAMYGTVEDESLPFAAVVLYDFDAEHTDELSVERGQHGTVHMYEPDDNWVVFTLHPDSLMVGDQAQGLVPRSYVEAIQCGEHVAGLDDTGDTQSGSQRNSIPRMDLMLSELVKRNGSAGNGESERRQSEEEVKMINQKLVDLQKRLDQCEHEKVEALKQVGLKTEELKQIHREVELQEKTAKVEMQIRFQEVEEKMRDEFNLERQNIRRQVQEEVTHQFRLEKLNIEKELSEEKNRNKVLENMVQKLQSSVAVPVQTSLETNVVQDNSYLGRKYSLDSNTEQRAPDSPTASSSTHKIEWNNNPCTNGFQQQKNEECCAKVKDLTGKDQTPKAKSSTSNATWIKAFDESYKRYYYYNTLTKVSSWIKPQDFKERPENVYVDN